MVRFALRSVLVCSLTSAVEVQDHDDGLELLQTRAMFTHAEDEKIDAEDFGEAGEIEDELDSQDASSLDSPYWWAPEGWKQCRLDWKETHPFCSHATVWQSDSGFKPPNCFKTVFKREQQNTMPVGATGKDYDMTQVPSVPPYNFQGSTPPSQVGKYGDMWGECYSVIQPDTVDRFNAFFSKFGCVEGTPANGIQMQNVATFEKKHPHVENIEECRKLAETSVWCAGANTYTFYSQITDEDPSKTKGVCTCAGGVTTLRTGQIGARSLTCALKSLPATQNQNTAIKYMTKTGVDMLASFKQSKTLTSCSKGWAFSGKYFQMPQYAVPKNHPLRRQLGLGGIHENSGAHGWVTWPDENAPRGYNESKTTISAWTERTGSLNWDAARNPSTCAAGVEEAIKDPTHGCFGAKGAVMTTEGRMITRRCMCYWGDPTPDYISFGPYDDGHFNDIAEPHSAFWAVDGQGLIFCIPDGGDYTEGMEYVKGAPASGVFDPEGPKPTTRPVLTPEEKAKCKAAKKNRKSLKEAYKKARQDHKAAREMARAAKLAKNAAKQAMLDNRDELENCPR